MNPKGRRAKSKARISAYETLLDQEQEKRNDEMEIYIPPGPRLGNVVITAENVSKAFGDTVLYEKLSLRFRPEASSVSSDRTGQEKRRCSA